VTARIRPYQPSDLDDLYRICLLTAFHGGDASGQYADPRMPGHIYAAPYGIFQPGFAFVAQDDEGVAGYILGARDSRDFAQRLERDWWPALRERYPDPAGRYGEWNPDQQAAHAIHHPHPLAEPTLAGYPSHLHIDLLPRLQSGGYGRALMRTLTAALRADGSPGVHLHVHRENVRARGFYRHLGFTELPENSGEALTLGLGLGLGLDLDLTGPPPEAARP
jgi:ribosomal protein S18 acetylase RimI-like enzyme